MLNNHIHEYERKKSSKEIYMCIHPQCRHYQNREYLIGKEALCHKCKQRFILTWTQLRNKRPVCIYCSQSPKARAMREIREVAREALNELPDEIKQQIFEQHKEENNDTATK